MGFLDRLRKISSLLSVTRGRHPESPGQAVDVPTNPVKPADRPHVRADTQTTVNFRMEKALVFTGSEQQPHTTVWRMQNERGEGPYREKHRDPNRQFALVWQDDHTDESHKRTPFPEQDGLDSKQEKDVLWREGMRNKYARLSPERQKEWRADKNFAPLFTADPGVHFGFKDEAQGHEWFSPTEMQKLSGMGYKLTPVKAKRVWAGNKQVMFERHEEPMGKAEGDPPPPKKKRPALITRVKPKKTEAHHVAPVAQNLDLHLAHMFDGLKTVKEMTEEEHHALHGKERKGQPKRQWTTEYRGPPIKLTKTLRAVCEAVRKSAVGGQYFVDFPEYKSVGHKAGAFEMWRFSKKDLANILKNWERSAVWDRRQNQATDNPFRTALPREDVSVPIKFFLQKYPQRVGRILYHGAGKDLPSAKALGYKHLNDPVPKGAVGATVHVYEPLQPEDLTATHESGKRKGQPKDPWQRDIRQQPDGPFDQVHSHYTMNVVDKNVGKQILQEIHDRLAENGHAFVSTARHESMRKSWEPLDKEMVFESNEKEPHREVWRIQNENGEGPYVTRPKGLGIWQDFGDQWQDETHHGKTGRPTPAEDSFTNEDIRALDPFGGQKFGFESEEHLKRWFSPTELSKLAKWGFHPVKVPARKIWSSGNQAFFEPHREEITRRRLAAAQAANPIPEKLAFSYDPRKEVTGFEDPEEMAQRKGKRPEPTASTQLIEMIRKIRKPLPPKRLKKSTDGGGPTRPGVGLAEADPTPRQEAAQETAEALTGPEYSFARRSKLGNKGEDIARSARHKINRWNGIQAAEAGGEADRLITREGLMKLKPLDLVSKVTPENWRHVLAAYFIMKRMPPAPKVSHNVKTDDPNTPLWSEWRPYGGGDSVAFHGADDESRPPVNWTKHKTWTLKDATVHARQVFNDTYDTLKAAAEDIAVRATDSSAVPQHMKATLIAKMKEWEKSGHTMGRRGAPTQGIYNDMVPYYNKMMRNSGKDMDKFLSAAGKAFGWGHPMDWETDTVGPNSEERLMELAKKVMEGKTVEKALGIMSSRPGKPARFNPVDAYLSEASRVGPENLPEKHDDLFGFLMDRAKLRGIQWGNSVTDSERAHHLSRAANAFKDLSQILDLPEEMISFNGRLAVAVGARGHGRALAHYEPSMHTINLTRASGAGSLAHEWGHFFDHVLPAVLRDTSTKDRVYASELDPGVYPAGDEKTKGVATALTKLQNFLHGPLRDRIRKEVSEDDGLRSTLSPNWREYWLSGRELFARSFERYVDRKLRTDPTHLNGRHNTYLSGFKGGSDAAAASRALLWPNQREDEILAPLFDALFAAFKNSPHLKKSFAKVLASFADKESEDRGGVDVKWLSGEQVLKKADKIKNMITQVADATKKDRSYGLYAPRFQHHSMQVGLSLPKRHMDSIQTIQLPAGMFHHIGTKGNDTYHVISPHSEPSAPGFAAIVTGKQDETNYIRGAHNVGIDDTFLRQLEMHVKGHDQWKYEEPISLTANQHMEKGWEQHHPDLVEGLVPDTNLKKLSERTVTPWLSFAGVRGDSTPRVIAKESLPVFKGAIHEMAQEQEEGASGTRVKELRQRSYFAHPTFTTAHREAAYSKLAADVFGLGEYVPRATVFRHPLSKEPWSVMEFVPGARPVRDSASELKSVTDNGDLYKLAIMNMILANNDRHENNMMLDATGKLKLIDHGLTFDYNHITTDVLPAYARHLLDTPVPESAHQWLWNLDVPRLANSLKEMGAPHEIIMHASGRLVDARKWSNIVKHGARTYDKTNETERSLGSLLDMMRIRQLDVPDETRNSVQSKIMQRMLAGEKPDPKDLVPGQATVKFDNDSVRIERPKLLEPTKMAAKVRKRTDEPDK